METQSTNNGLTQLFMNLGLSTASPLEGIDGATLEEGAGFDSLLAGYLPQGSSLPPGIIKQSPQQMTGLIPMGIEQDLEETSLLASEITDNVNDGNAEGLPLLGADLGEALPLSPVALSLPRNTALADTVDALATGQDDLSPSDLADQENGQALLDSHGFHAQSLVSSVIPNKDMNMSSNKPLADALNTLPGNANAAATIASSVDTKKMVDPLASTANTALDSESLAIDEEGDSLINSDAGLNRFKREKPLNMMDSMTPQSPSAFENSVSGVASTLSTENTSVINAALAMNENPTDLSLQELSDLEDADKALVDNKILSAERKQDDQTLRLSKGQQAWGDALAGRITMNAAKDIQQVTIHLDPPELGSLELKLNVKDDQQTQVQVQVQNPQVKEALESSASRLRDMLAEQGLELSEFDVQTGSQQGGQNNSQESDVEQLADQQDSDALSNDTESSMSIPTPKNNNLLDTFV